MIPMPFNEPHRAAVLHHLNAMDSKPDPSFDRITRLAADYFTVPIALISLVGPARQWFKSSVGLETADTPRDISFCGHAIMSDEVLVVADATKDPRFAHNPLVTGEPYVRFYAGAPLITPTGFRLGTLCIIDQEPRASFGESKRAILRDMAAMATDEFYRQSESKSESTAAGRTGFDSDPAGPGRSELREFEAAASRDAQLQFIASLTHELRTPLNAIMGFSEAIAKEIFGPIANHKYVEYAHYVCDGGDHLIKIVNSVLDFAKAEKGEFTLSEELVDLAGVARHCGCMFTEELRLAGLDYRWSAAEDLPNLKADPQQLKQMMVNLIGNSIKFTPPGGSIRVEADVMPEGGLTVMVSDSGIGIAEEDLKSALEPFSQIDNDRNRELSGTGLGLSLTHQLMQLHGGELAIESRVGEGTKVHLKFPDYRVVPKARMDCEKPA